MKVSVSILSSFGDKEVTTKKLISEYDKTNVDYIHIDIMDGKFVPRKTFSFNDIKVATSGISKKLDVHLMVNNPKKYISDYALLNVEYITFHYEAVKDIDEMISYIKCFGLKVGIAINPETPIDVLFPYLNQVDLILIMSINPRASYQTFMESSVEKVAMLREKIDDNGYKIVMNIDGGINEESSLLVKDYVDMVVSDSFIKKDKVKNIEFLRKIK